MTVSVFAPAKINLTLHVTGQRPDGYHLLDSLVAFGPVGDILSVATADAPFFTVKGPESTGVPVGNANLVSKVSRLLAADVTLGIDLKKNLPPASGIGGGSADAAAMARALILGGNEVAQSLRTTSDLEPEGVLRRAADRLLALGADIPMCLAPGPKRVTGIGDQMSAVEIPRLNAVLVNPRVGVSTPAVFQALTQKNNPPMGETIPQGADAATFCEWLGQQRNDLQRPAVQMFPQIANLLDLLAQQNGCRLARMSGSGATCFAIFETAQKAATSARLLKQTYPEWWIASGGIGDFRAESMPVTS